MALYHQAALRIASLYLLAWCLARCVVSDDLRFGEAALYHQAALRIASLYSLAWCLA
ncbi:MAG: hypothetical protein MJZ63_02965 [Muribaculaceae bacterium]|nr:hypothetical protein [Muribaculaceae bacterium]